jgi:hypothetical protein
MHNQKWLSWCILNGHAFSTKDVAAFNRTTISGIVIQDFLCENRDIAQQMLSIFHLRKGGQQNYIFVEDTHHGHDDF